MATMNQLSRSELTLALAMHQGRASAMDVDAMFQVRCLQYREDHGRLPDWNPPETIEDYDYYRELFKATCPLDFIAMRAEMCQIEHLQIALAHGQVKAEETLEAQEQTCDSCGVDWRLDSCDEQVCEATA